MVETAGFLAEHEWPLGITCYDAMTYKHEGACQWFPYFCPMGVLSPCCLIGRIQTGLVDEEPCCCDMGPRGCFYCMCTAPISIWGPLGGIVFFSLLAPCYRSQVREKYNLPKRSKGDECCEGSCCHTIWIGCNYPCVFFQLFMVVKHFRAHKDHKIPVATPVATNPMR